MVNAMVYGGYIYIYNVYIYIYCEIINDPCHCPSAFPLQVP